MIDLSGAISNVNSASNLILVNPQKNIGIRPKATGLVEPESFLFHIDAEQNVQLTSDVTDHYVEDNTAIQDQVSLKPVTVTGRGYIGELNNVLPPFLEVLKIAQEKLTELSPFVPGLTAKALIAFNTAQQAANAALVASAAAGSVWNSLPGSKKTEDLLPGETNEHIQNKQQVAFNKFYGWWANRQLFSVQTPWAIFDDMIIMSLRAVQEEDSKVITDFEVTFKKMNFARTAISINSQGRASAQSSVERDMGRAKLGEELPLRNQLAISGIA